MNIITDTIYQERKRYYYMMQTLCNTISEEPNVRNTTSALCKSMLCEVEELYLSASHDWHFAKEKH